MADLNAVPARKGRELSGEWGNVTAAHFTYTFAAGQIADVALLGKLPQGAKVVDINMRNAALGASSTIALGYRKVDPASSLSPSAAAYLAATATSSAGTTRGSFAPIQTNEEVYVTATIAGGAVTGQLDVTFFYIFENV